MQVPKKTDGRRTKPLLFEELIHLIAIVFFENVINLVIHPYYIYNQPEKIKRL
jgi:hypothetical protein